MPEIIKFNSVDFEENIYDVYTCMEYKGKPFTGTLIYENEIIEYKDGNANGRCYEHWENGQLAFDGIYENGDCIHSKSWYRNGQLHKDYTLMGDCLIYDLAGNLVSKNYSYFYKNGNYKIKKSNVFRDNSYTEYFNEKGELALIFIQGKGNEKSTIKYYDNVLTNCYIQLLTSLPLEVDFSENSLNILVVIPWLVSMYNKGSKEKIIALGIIEELNNWENMKINYDFKLFYEKIKKNENDYFLLDMRGYSFEVIE